MSDYLADLRARAEAATPGPWVQDEPMGWSLSHGQTFVCMGPSGDSYKHSTVVRRVDAEYIATFDPPAVTALLDVAQAADGLLTHYHDDFAGAFTTLQAALARLRTLTGEDQT